MNAPDKLALASRAEQAGGPVWFSEEIAAQHCSSYWREQSENARLHAFARNPTDLDGFFEDLRNADRFARMAKFARALASTEDRTP